ncbi:MAG TPA: aminotransferase class V-fold PLP-dependent enzyme [Dehalococcoidia bacterium]|nr:aminotransferase class V-fold PLP-dependent enzyme [Dehalococcoidia bacterium]
MSEERWAWLRSQMPVMQNYAYMNSGFSGPLTTDVVDAMKQRLQLELDVGPTTREVMEDRQQLVARMREVTAEMIGADADEIAIMGNTTEGLNVVVNGVDIQPGDGVITTSVEHASGAVPAYYLRERRGAEMSIVPIAADDSAGVVLENFAQALNDRTKLVILSEISYSTGQLLPMNGIIEASHRVGARVVVDGAQTAGHIPIDVRASGIDCYAIPSHKWLLGPDGLGALYVRRDAIPDVEPSKVAGRAAAEWDSEGNFTPEKELITKYELTTTSGALIAGTIAATEQYLESGPQAVFDRARELTKYAEERFGRIRSVTVKSPTTEGARTGLFCFHTEGIDSAEIAFYLQSEAKVVCRGVRDFDVVRLSLHAFNNEADIDTAADAVETIVAEGIPEAIKIEVAERAARMRPGAER